MSERSRIMYQVARLLKVRAKEVESPARDIRMNANAACLLWPACGLSFTWIYTVTVPPSGLFISNSVSQSAMDPLCSRTTLHSAPTATLPSLPTALIADVASSVGCQYQEYAYKYDIAVVVTNHVIDDVRDDGPPSAFQVQ